MEMIDEMCVTSYTIEGEKTAVDMVSLEDLQEGITIPDGMYVTAYAVSTMRH